MTETVCRRGQDWWTAPDLRHWPERGDIEVGAQPAQNLHVFLDEIGGLGCAGAGIERRGRSRYRERRPRPRGEERIDLPSSRDMRQHAGLIQELLAIAERKRINDRCIKQVRIAVALIARVEVLELRLGNRAGPPVDRFRKRVRDGVLKSARHALVHQELR